MLRLLLLLAWACTCWSARLEPLQAPGHQRALMAKVPTLLPRDTAKQIQEIKACWKRWGINSTTAKDRLPAVYLHAHCPLKAAWRNPLLKCSISQLFRHIEPSTPLDIYVFARKPDNLTQFLSSTEPEFRDRVCVVSIPNEQWRYDEPRPVPYKLAINRDRAWYHEYYVMGQWRLLIPYNIMASVGYEYVMQVDDDLYVYKPYKVNFVEEMRRNNYLFGTHRDFIDKPHVLHGLPELADFFVTSNRLAANATLWQHVKPGNRDGLYSSESLEEGHGGYDRAILNGNFMLMSTSLWMEDRVQDWVALCMSSGGMERHRWQEQGVISWVWLLFTEPQQLWRLTLSHVHSKKAEFVEPVCGKGYGVRGGHHHNPRHHVA